jgi:putative NADH-flavin reductase
MIITVFGASGRVGRLVVAEAIARGHTVKAFVHRTNVLGDNPHLTIVQGSVHDRRAVAAAVYGSQGVISTLGSWGSPRKDIVSTGMRSIIPAMESAGIERIVSITGSDAYDSTDELTLRRRCSHLFARIAAGKILADGEKHIKLLRTSSLDWTVLRSPAMTNGARIFYKLSLQPVASWQPIPRKAVAKALLDQLDGPGYSAAAPFLHRY